MTKATLILILFFYLAGTSFGQSCDCPKVLDSVNAYLTRNYAGFNDKLQIIGSDRYDQHLKTYRTKVKAIANPLHCFLLLDEWIAIFKDDHLYFDYAQDPAFSNVIG